MHLVVDSNILFSIIISGEKSKAFKVIKKYSVDLFFPEEGLLEFKEHKNKLKTKEFEFRMFLAFSLIHIIPQEFYLDKIREAYEIARNFDEDDTPFIALALKLNIPVWTNDKDFIIYGLRSGKFLALDTDAVEELLKSKSLDEVKENLRKRYQI